MDDAPPRYLLGPSGPATDRVREALSPLEPVTPASSVDELLASGDARPGWVFLSPEVPVDEVLSLALEVGRRAGPWSPVLLREGDGGLEALPLSPGFAEPLDEAVTALAGSGDEEGRRSFRHALDLVARVRHDINNPLTAALAEIQLLLMDIPRDSDEGRALGTVEEQLHRIRDLVADLQALRVRGT